MDRRGTRFTEEAYAFAKRYYQMEQGMRRLAGVEDRMWSYPVGASLSPGVRYAPPGPPRNDPEPAWRQGFFH